MTARVPSFDVLCSIPSLLADFRESSVIGRAAKNGVIEINVHDLRDFTTDKHRTVDDRPFGGGAGMVMKPEPLFTALESLRAEACRLVYLSPQGSLFTQAAARAFAEWFALPSEHPARILIICGRYEGVDERVIEYFSPELISIGDYVISGGEVAAMVFIEAVARLIPGVLGNEESTKEESHEAAAIEYPHYTRPADFRGMKVPDVLLSGNHEEIRKWRAEESLKRTRSRRPDLLKKT